MAEIYDLSSGAKITAGLQGRAVCDAAIQCARRMASERRGSVVLEDDGDNWLVGPRGGVRRFTPALKTRYDWSQEPVGQ